MADILPTRPDPPSDDKEPRVVGLDGEEVSELLSAISSETARTILSALHEKPATPSEVADDADTSIQNAQYHLGKLEDAGLIEPGGTAYSEKGREMTVYTPADRALVVVAGNEDDTNGLQSVLSQLLGGLGVVALGSVVVDRLTRTAAGPSVSLADRGGDGGGAAGESASGGAAGGGGAGANATGSTATPAAQPTTAQAGADAPTSTPTSAPTATPANGGGGFSIAEAPSTAQETGTHAVTQTAAQTETATRTVAEAARTAEATHATGTAHTADATRTALETVTAQSGGTPGIPALATLGPAELFFLGGVVTLVCATAYWWIRR